MKYKTERNIQALVQLALSEHGITNFRNNVGGTKTESGGWVDYGVGGKGGSDLICVTPVKITADMVGKTVGVFTAIEVKNKTGRVSVHQRRFIDHITALGGFAGVARSPDEALKIASAENIIAPKNGKPSDVKK